MFAMVRKASLRAENHEEHKKNLVAELKKNVKSLMELLAYRKLVQEDASLVSQLCLTVESCIRHGLKRRGFESFSNSDNYYVDLLTKLDQSGCPSAAFVHSRLRNIMERKSPSAPPSTISRVFSFGSKVEKTTRFQEPVKTHTLTSLSTDKLGERLLWVHIALVERHLLQIIGSLVTNCMTFYHPYALLADPVSGPLIPALLAGPCSIDFSSHFRGSELPFYCDTYIEDRLNKRRLSNSMSGGQKVPSRQNLLNRARHFSIAAGDIKQPTAESSSSNEVDLDFIFCSAGMNWPGNKAPELIYAKNNVAMEPFSGSVAVLGYLAICLSPVKNSDDNSSAIIRWTPNNLFHSSSSSDETNTSKRLPTVVTICLLDISYIHFHMRPHSDSHATVVFIGRDGVQFPALMFKEAASALSFLQALINVIPENTRLEPPLTPSVFTVGDESRDLVFQLVPNTPKSAAASTPYFILYSPDEPKTEGDNQKFFPTDKDIDEEEQKKDDDQKQPSKLVTSKSDVDINANTDENLPVYVPSSKSFSLGLSKTLEAALSAATNAGAQYFNEIENLDNSLSNSSAVTFRVGSGRLGLVCRSVQRQLMARAFYGWLAYVRHVKTVRTQLAALVLGNDNEKLETAKFDFDEILIRLNCTNSLDSNTFDQLKEMHKTKPNVSRELLHRIIYSGGVCQAELRPRVWSVLLGISNLGTPEADFEKYFQSKAAEYSALCLEWRAAEIEAESLAASNKLISSVGFTPPASSTTPISAPPVTYEDKESVFQEGESNTKVHVSFPPEADETPKTKLGLRRSSSASGDFRQLYSEKPVTPDTSVKRRLSDSFQFADVDDFLSSFYESCKLKQIESSLVEDKKRSEDPQIVMYSNWLTNLHRIDKDVARCDRSLDFYKPENPENLAALRRIVCTYVWQNIDVGYIQGMCDLAAPFLVVCKQANVKEAEPTAYTLFSKLMLRLGKNFPTGAISSHAAIDVALSRLRSLLQILDPELYEHLSDSPSDMDGSHLYFAYRWLLLDFKREFVYDDVFRIWETIWAADDVASPVFSLFIAFALIETYRNTIITESMDFTDIIKYFNDKAERHNIEKVLDLARQLVRRVQEASLASCPISPIIANLS